MSLLLSSLLALLLALLFALLLASWRKSLLDNSGQLLDNSGSLLDEGGSLRNDSLLDDGKQDGCVWETCHVWEARWLRVGEAGPGRRARRK